MSSPSPFPRRLIGGAVAAACVTLCAHAEEFSWQLSGAKRQAESANFESDSWAVDATFYMKPIDDSEGPYGLASFLNPTTRVSAAASRNDTPQDVFADPTAYTLSGAYVLPGEKWYVGADYAKADVGDAPPLTISGPKGYGVRAGRYLGANTTLEIGVGRSEQKSALSCGLLCLGIPLEIELTTDSVDLEVFHVRRFRSLTYSLQGRVSERETDAEFHPPNLPGVTLLAGGPEPVRQYSVAGELFPTQQLGVRVGYSEPSSDFDVKGYDVGVTWFFKPRIAVQFAFAETSAGDAPPGLGRSESVGVRFIGRL